MPFFFFKSYFKSKFRDSTWKNETQQRLTDAEDKWRGSRDDGGWGLGGKGDRFRSTTCQLRNRHGDVRDGTGGAVNGPVTTARRQVGAGLLRGSCCRGSECPVSEAHSELIECRT